MRWFITLLLIILVTVGGLWLGFEDRIRATVIGVSPGNSPTAKSSARLTELANGGGIQAITLTQPQQPPLVLTKNADGTWSQPGNWPLRDSEVAVLVNAITSLRSRFDTIPVAGDDFAPYGLAASQSPIQLKVDVRTDAVTRTLTLLIAQPESKESDTAFSRTTYVRVDQEPEVVRLGPDVFTLFARSPEVYRRRQLFPDAERVKLSAEAFNLNQPLAVAGGRVAILGDAYSGIKLERLTGTPSSLSFTRVAKTPEARRDPDRPNAEPSLNPNQLATAWEFLDEKLKLRDNVDPAKLRGVLTAVPELWVESFIPASKTGNAETGLDQPERSISVTRADGKTVTVLLGKVSRNVTRVEEAPRVTPGMPPQQPKATTEEYRYAKLKDNDLVFELRADKLDAIFSDPQDYRDATLARFESGEVTGVQLAVRGKPPIALTKKEGKKDADRDDEKQDRWYLGDQLAEPAKVTELLDQLGKLEAKGKDAVVDSTDAAKLNELELDAASTKLTVTTQPRTVPGDTPLSPRTVTYVIGKADAEKKKLAVQVTGRARVNLVDDAVLKLIDRPALAYRSRKLFDTVGVKLETLTVKRDTGDTFALTGAPKKAPATGTAWSLTQPIAMAADESKADQLANTLSRLEVVEYVDDAAKPEDVEKKYGLAKPRFTVDLGFNGPGAKAQKLEVGAVRDTKPEVYTRLNGTGSVFSVPKTLVDSLEGGALALLAPQLWSVPTDKMRSLEITRGVSAEKYAIKLDNGQWKLSGPFDATVPKPTVDPLIAAVAELKADKFETLTVTDPAKYGFDKPSLRIVLQYLETVPMMAEQPATRTLVIGKPTPEGASRYAKVEGGTNPAVFTVPETVLKSTDKPALELLDKTLLSLDPAKIATVQITTATADNNVTLTKDDKDIWKPTGAAFTVDGPTVQGLTFLAARPLVSRIAAYGANVKWADFGLDKPEYTITIELPTTPPEVPVKHTLKLGKAEPTGERYVRVDDGLAVGVLPGRAAESLARGKLDFVDRTLFTFDPALLTSVLRTKGKDELELTQTGVMWEVVKPAKLKADKQTLEDLADQLSRLRAVKVAAFAPTDLDKPYGLKEPAAIVTLKLGTDKPETKVLKIGAPVDATKPDGDRYAMVDPQTVGVLAGPLAKKLLSDAIKFRDKSLAKFVDADKLTLERGDRKVTFAKVAGTWKVTEPTTADAEQTEIEELVNALANLRADEILTDKPEKLEEFGLKNPDAKWQLFADDKPVLTLLLGAKEKDGSRVHAMIDKGNLVALLDPILTGKVLGEYRKRAVWTDVDASQIESVVISSGASNVVLQKTGTDWRDPTKPDEKIDPAKVTEFLAAFAALKAERYASDKDAKLGLYGLEKPQRVIVINQKGSVTKTLQLGGPEGTSAGKRVYAKVNDPTRTDAFILSDIDTVKLTVSSFMANKK